MYSCNLLLSKSEMVYPGRPQMQEQLRKIGPSKMPKEVMERFTRAYEEGKLVKPEDVGHVIASLSLKAPKSLSGQFVSWDSDECKDFRRRK